MAYFILILLLGGPVLTIVSIPLMMVMILVACWKIARI